MSTKNHTGRVLIVDDDPIVAESLADLLTAEGYGVATANDGDEALDLLAQNSAESTSKNGGETSGGGGGAFGILIVDADLARMDGMTLLRQARERFPAVTPIMISSFGKIDAAVEAVKLGAIDYLTKPLVDDELRLAVNKAANQHALVAENATLKNQLTERYGLGSLIGADYRMQKVYDLIEAVAQSKTTVLINGESGTGKSMVGRAIHTMSPRGASGGASGGGPFVTFSCGSIPETLLESELFGHTKGAFTGADYDKPGKILAADGGTLFIDEINSATPALQLKLLRVLQEKAFEPIGSTQTRQVDVRFVLATNQDLTGLVESGVFREDLYYRVNVVNIRMPSLRDRPGDVPALADHFLEKYCTEVGKARRLSRETVQALQAHDWPGNVRELENAIERAVVLSKAMTIEPDDLPETLNPGGPNSPGKPGEPGAGANGHGANGNGHGPALGRVIPALASGWTPTPLDQAMAGPERAILDAALRANDWNRQATARDLHINRTTLYKKIKTHRLDEPA